MLQIFKRTSLDSMVYGVGSCKDWCRLHRDVLVDLKKFSAEDFLRLKDTLQLIKYIEVRGEGYIDNVEVSHRCHKGNSCLLDPRLTELKSS